MRHFFVNHFYCFVTHFLDAIQAIYWTPIRRIMDADWTPS